MRYRADQIGSFLRSPEVHEARKAYLDGRITLDALRKDRTIKESLGDHILSHFVDAKTIEFDDYRVTVHGWELAQYLAEY